MTIASFRLSKVLVLCAGMSLVSCGVASSKFNSEMPGALSLENGSYNLDEIVKRFGNSESAHPTDGLDLTKLPIAEIVPKASPSTKAGIDLGLLIRQLDKRANERVLQGLVGLLAKGEGMVTGSGEYDVRASQERVTQVLDLFLNPEMIDRRFTFTKKQIDAFGRALSDSSVKLNEYHTVNFARSYRKASTSPNEVLSFLSDGSDKDLFATILRSASEVETPVYKRDPIRAEFVVVDGEITDIVSDDGTEKPDISPASKQRVMNVLEQDGYGYESWFYFNTAIPQIAAFTSGARSLAGIPLRGKAAHERGNTPDAIWEAEEFGHWSVFKDMYETVTGETFSPSIKTVSEVSFRTEALNNYEQIVAAVTGILNKQIDEQLAAKKTPVDQMKIHASRRAAAEVSASAGYIWLIAHSQGHLQMRIANILQQELGHLAKFWAIYRWAFQDQMQKDAFYAISDKLIEMARGVQDIADSATGVQQKRTIAAQADLLFTFWRVVNRMRTWDEQMLTNERLFEVFGKAPIHELSKEEMNGKMLEFERMHQECKDVIIGQLMDLKANYDQANPEAQADLEKQYPELLKCLKPFKI